MANMSYCRFENTYNDLIDCIENLNQPASNERDERYRIRLIELLIDTPWYVPQPHRVPVDLSLADDDLWLMIEQGVKKLPGFMSQSDWLMQMKVKIAAADKHRLTNSI